MNILFFALRSFNFLCAWTSSYSSRKAIFFSWFMSINLWLRYWLSFWFYLVYALIFYLTSLIIISSYSNIILFPACFSLCFFFINFWWRNFFGWMKKMFILLSMRKRSEWFSRWSCWFFWASIAVVSASLSWSEFSIVTSFSIDSLFIYWTAFRPLITLWDIGSKLIFSWTFWQSTFSLVLFSKLLNSFLEFRLGIVNKEIKY